MEREELAQKTLPLATTASSCDEGIRVSAFGCNGIIYEDTSGKLPEALFRKGGGRRLRVQVDSRSMYRVIVEHPETRELIICTLKIRSCPQFRTWSWAEGAAYQLRIKKGNAKKQDKVLDQWAEDYDRTEQVNAAALEARLNAGPTTRAQVKNSAKAGREAERQRETEARPNRIPDPPPSRVNPFEPDEDDDE